MRFEITPDDLPRDVIELCRTLRQHGYRAWMVGGCLRDLLLGKSAADFDLATDARPEQVQAVFPRVIPTGVQHGTVTVRHRGKSFEVTTLRGEGAYTDGRRPDSVAFVSDIEADLARRDFTINAIAYDPLEDVVTDPFHGVNDLEAGVVRAVGDPLTRFAEDGLRVLRAARFAATLAFALDPDTEAAIRPTLDTFRKVSAERVREEWLKALKAREPSPAFAIMARTGILDVTAPALANLPEVDFQRALSALRAAPLDSIHRLAALFHPIVDFEWVEDWLVRYRFSNAERENVLRLLRHASPEGAATFTDADVRRFAQRVGREHVFEVAEFGVLIASVGSSADSEATRVADELLRRVRQLVRKDVPLTTKDLAVSGRDLMTTLGMAPGPALGQILDALLAQVIEDPTLNTRETLLQHASALSEDR